MGHHPDLSKEAPLVTREGLESTFDSPDHNISRSQVKLAEDLGIVPLGYFNPHLTALNLLASWQHWSGGISHFDLIDTDIDLRFQPELVKAAESLDLKVRSQSDKAIEWGEGSRLYGRVLSEMGILNTSGGNDTPERKHFSSHGVPPYIAFLAEKYRNLRGDNKKVARKLLSDHAQVLLQSRLKHNNGCYSVRVHPSSVSSDDAKRKSLQVLSLFTALYPKMELSESNLSPWSAHNETQRQRLYYQDIGLPMDAIAIGAGRYGLFKIDIQPTVEYHNENNNLGTNKRK